MEPNAVKIGELFFLLHPGEVEFSGYGLTVEAGNLQRLVGILMVDRPKRVSRTWLAKVERTFGSYELYSMTPSGERGIACQMWIAEESLQYVQPLTDKSTRSLQAAFYPFLLVRPKPHFLVTWDAAVRMWRSEFYQPPSDEEKNMPSRTLATPRFALGRVVATPGALEALQEAGQLPQEFLSLHMRGIWGQLDEHDRQMNEDALHEGGRLFSAYFTKKNVKLWVITEADHSVTTILMPSEY